MQGKSGMLILTGLGLAAGFAISAISGRILVTTAYAKPAGEIERGRYLVEEVAKCSECHTPRKETGRKPEPEGQRVGNVVVIEDLQPAHLQARPPVVKIDLNGSRTSVVVFSMNGARFVHRRPPSTRRRTQEQRAHLPLMT
jgi:hypothetical protein